MGDARVFVSQPTIKKPDKNKKFENQEISTEHHLNLFIKHEDLDDYMTEWEMHSHIGFTGIVNNYTRKNGTKTMEFIQQNNLLSIMN